MRFSMPLLVALSLALALPVRGADAPSVPDRDTAARILGRALIDEGAWRKLEHLTTRFGHRLSGSASLEKAVAWAEETMRKEKLEGVRLQAVTVPHWVRGRESARVVAPVCRAKCCSR